MTRALEKKISNEQLDLQQFALGYDHNRTASGSERVGVTSESPHEVTANRLLPLAVLFVPPAAQTAPICKLL
jgi:hypothetical protein